MEALFSYIQEYGYLFVFLATFFEGETVLALAAFAASQGYLSLEWVFLSAFFGGFLGDQAYFFIGHFHGGKFLRARPKLLARVEGVHRLIERFPNSLIFGSRFMYGFRILLPIAFGTSKVSPTRFFIFNLLGALVWSALFSFIGYVFGSALELYVGEIHRVEGYLMAGAVIGILLFQAASLLRKKIAQKVEAAEKKVVPNSLDNDQTTGG